MSSIRFNIRRAVDLLTLSAYSFIRYPWNIGATYSYEIATPSCVGYNSSNDLRLTYYFYQRLDNDNNTITERYNDVSDGMITSNIQSCWLKCCKHRIKVRKQLNKSRSAFTLQDDIAISSDNRPCQEQCLDMACGPVADSEAPMYVGNGTTDNPMTIDFNEPPHYHDIISPTTGGIIYNAGTLTREVTTLSAMEAASGGNNPNPIPQDSTTLNANTVRISPNPASETINFNIFSSYEGTCVLEIYNTYNVLLISNSFSISSLNST